MCESTTTRGEVQHLCCDDECDRLDYHAQKYSNKVSLPSHTVSQADQCREAQWYENHAPGDQPCIVATVDQTVNNVRKSVQENCRT